MNGTCTMYTPQTIDDIKPTCKPFFLRTSLIYILYFSLCKMKLHDMFYTIHLLIIVIIQLNKQLYDTFELFIIQMKSFFF